MEFAIREVIHVLHGRARMVAAHTAIADDAARRIFGRGYRPDITRLTAAIERLDAEAGHPSCCSGFVALELTADSDRLVYADTSIYEGYALRTITPDAVCVECGMPVSYAPTTARAAVCSMADAVARRRGAQVALCHDREGRLCMADNAPVFGLAGRQILGGGAVHSVEGDLLLKAAADCGFHPSSETMTTAHIPHLDEIFYVDHRGITSLAHCDGYPLMMLLTERLAGAMERRFPKK